MASLTLCCIYCDYFELYQPGKVRATLASTFGALGPRTLRILLGASTMLPGAWQFCPPFAVVEIALSVYIT